MSRLQSIDFSIVCGDCLNKCVTEGESLKLLANGNKKLNAILVCNEPLSIQPQHLCESRVPSYWSKTRVLFLIGTM